MGGKKSRVQQKGVRIKGEYVAEVNDDESSDSGWSDEDEQKIIILLLWRVAIFQSFFNIQYRKTFLKYIYNIYKKKKREVGFVYSWEE